MPVYRSLNPYSGELYGIFSYEPLPDLKAVVRGPLQTWQAYSVTERIRQLKAVAALLEERRDQIAALITAEMGKPLREAYYEIDKSLRTFEYYFEQGEAFLAPRKIETGNGNAMVTFEGLGIILCIMPWNFPVWQVMRCSIPALLSGNGILLKHAPNVPSCSRALGSLFRDAGIPEGLFQEVFLDEDGVRAALSSPEIAGLSFTGSDYTGALLAGWAGTHLKKVVMELGGNDPFIVRADANLDAAVAAALKSRGINSGQSCNAAKRFLVHASVYTDFYEKLKTGVDALKVGNPLDPDTDIGPLARPDLAAKVRTQIRNTIEEGALPHYHPGKALEKDNVVYPVILRGCRLHHTAFREEVFGPVFSLSTFDSDEEAIHLANHTVYGLGASIWTADLSKALEMSSRLQTGNVFINEMVKSDARLPFGGVKRSGYGRELSEYGLLEFVNIKTVVIHSSGL